MISEFDLLFVGISDDHGDVTIGMRARYRDLVCGDWKGKQQSFQCLIVLMPF